MKQLRISPQLFRAFGSLVANVWESSLEFNLCRDRCFAVHNLALRMQDWTAQGFDFCG